MEPLELCEFYTSLKTDTFEKKYDYLLKQDKDIFSEKVIDHLNRFFDHTIKGYIHQVFKEAYLV